MLKSLNILSLIADGTEFMIVMLSVENDQNYKSRFISKPS